MALSDTPKKKRIFVAMPFRAEHSAVFSTVKDAAQLLGADVIRLDEQSFTGSIVSQIRSEIEGADLVTAIVSEENGNVYYEIGLAHCQKKPVVLLTSDASSLKFDLRDHRAIVYDPARPAGIRDELVRTIRSVIDVPAEPHAFLASVFKGPQSSAHEVETGLQNAVSTLARIHCLQQPYHLSHMQVLPGTKEMAIVVEDFLKVTVRAVIDINGIVRTATRI